MEEITSTPSTPTASVPAVAAKVSVAVSTPSTSTTTTTNVDKGTLEFDPSLSEDERRFYMKAYPSIELVRERKVHCTICKCHIGTAPSQETAIKMHPVLRVTQCTKCHDFYNSGEFSKGEDGSELYCRWCGQGGEVYCCSNCPYVFCKSCIVKNLSRGVVADIEQNENWSCFNCAPKILWPLRAQHWALINYIDKQKKTIQSLHISESEMKQQMAKDRSTCCRLAKSKCGNMSDSLESIDSIASKRSLGSSSSAKKAHKISVAGIAGQPPTAKRAKTSNDVVVCTPDLMSMLEPDCQITVSNKPRPPQSSPTTSSPKVISIQSNYGAQTSTPVHNTAPPPLVLRNTGIQLRHPSPAPIIRRTVIGPRPPNSSGGSSAPVYHTINGFRIDLNSAAQQETFRLPNGKLIQVKRQGTQSGGAGVGTANVSPNNWQQRTPGPIIQHGARPVQITHASPQSRYITVQHSPSTATSSPNYAQQQQVVRYHNTMVGNTSVTAVGHNGSGAQIQLINGAPQATAAGVSSAQTSRTTPVMVRHVFPDTPIGQARTQLQDQVFNAMEICQHLTGKVQTLTNSNAYKQARNYLEVKELYIHLSYLLTYAIGRFKGLQDKCLGDMRQLGFVNDADSLENGQLAAGVDYVRYGQLDEVDLFNTGCNSFHNQVYEYRKSLHANLEDDDEAKKQPLSPLIPLGNAGFLNDVEEGGDGGEESDWPMQEDSHQSINYDDMQEMNDENDEPEDTFADEEQQGDAEDEDKYYNSVSQASAHHSTEDYMSREEEAHAYDRKLTRLIEQYPSIWCTRHHDYGNFEVTRKQWRTIASHFKRTESLNIKIRWKNIRKRFVRIERRVREGKRFHGYFDKATNFLANRDLPMSEWLDIDRGEIDGDIYERKQLDVVEHALYPVEEKAENGFAEQQLQLHNDDYRQRSSFKPIEIRPVDLKIINFVKCNQVLWRKTSDPMCNKVDEQSRKCLWMHLWKSMPHLSCGDIIDRWNHLYEMYKTFRLKTIKDENALAHLELKYSKYLAKLYFLYKIDENDLKNENNIFEDCFGLEDEGDDDDECTSSSNSDKKLQDMPDDKEFLLELVRTVHAYPMLWNIRHVDYHDIVMRESVWNEIGNKLQEFKRNIKTIKLRWQLAKYSYYRLRRERQSRSNGTTLLKYCKNLPADEMLFLDF